MMADDQRTHGLDIDAATAWYLFDLIQVHLAGLGHRDETAQPWHLESVFSKLIYALGRMEGPHAVSEVTLDLTADEVRALIENIPRTAWDGARALLLRLFHLAAAFLYPVPILLDDLDETPGTAARLAQIKGYGIETVSGGG